MFDAAQSHTGGPKAVASKASTACAVPFDEFEAAYVTDAPFVPLAERTLGDDQAWVRFEAEAQASAIRKVLERAVERVVQRRGER